MILRLIAFSVLAYVLGFALYAVSLGEPAPADSPDTQAIVVLTGGPGRIEQAVDRLAQGKAERLLIAGADPVVTQGDMAARLGGMEGLLECCVDIGSESVDTKSNAEEAARWLNDNHFGELRLVTSDWHMRRAYFEFRRELGDDVTIIADAVASEPNFYMLFSEYNKYVLRRVAILVGL